LHPPEGVPGFRTNYGDVVQAALRAVLQVGDVGEKHGFSVGDRVRSGGGGAVRVGDVDA